MKNKSYSQTILKEEKHKSNRWITFVLLLMFATILGLGMKINEKVHFMTHPLLTNFMNISHWIPYENWFQPYDHTVSASMIYHRLSENYFVNGTNQCAVIANGIVLSSQENQVIILQDNGIMATYGNLDERLIKNDERVLKGAVIGTFTESVTLDFELNGEKMDYESALAT